jgi:hypothetical protein
VRNKTKKISPLYVSGFIFCLRLFVYSSVFGWCSWVWNYLKQIRVIVIKCFYLEQWFQNEQIHVFWDSFCLVLVVSSFFWVEIHLPKLRIHCQSKACIFPIFLRNHFSTKDVFFSFSFHEDFEREISLENLFVSTKNLQKIRFLSFNGL